VRVFKKMLVTHSAGAWAALYHDKRLQIYSLHKAERVYVLPVEVDTMAFHPGEEPILAAATKNSVQIYGKKRGKFAQIQSVRAVNVSALIFSFEYLWCLAGRKLEGLMMTFQQRNFVHLSDEPDKSLTIPQKARNTTGMSACSRALALEAGTHLHIWCDEAFLPPLEHAAPIRESQWRSRQDGLVIVVLAGEGFYIWRESPLYDEMQFRLELMVYCGGIPKSIAIYEKIPKEYLYKPSHHRPSTLVPNTRYLKPLATMFVACTVGEIVKLFSVDLPEGKVLSYTFKDIAIPNAKRMIGLHVDHKIPFFVIETTHGDLEEWDATSHKLWALSTERGSPISIMSAHPSGILACICGNLIRWYDPPHKDIHVGREIVEGSWVDLAMIRSSSTAYPKAVAVNDEGEVYLIAPVTAGGSPKSIYEIANVPRAQRVFIRDDEEIILQGRETIQLGEISYGEVKGKIGTVTWHGRSTIPIPEGALVSVYQHSFATCIQGEAIVVDGRTIPTKERVMAIEYGGDSLAALFESGFIHLWSLNDGKMPIFLAKQRLPRAQRKQFEDTNEGGAFRSWNVQGPVSISASAAHSEDSCHLLSGRIEFQRMVGDVLICVFSGMNADGLCGPTVMVRTRGDGESWKTVSGWETADKVTAWCIGDRSFHLADDQVAQFRRWSPELKTEAKNSLQVPLYHPDALYHLSMHGQMDVVQQVLHQLQGALVGREPYPTTSVKDGIDTNFDLALLQERLHSKLANVEPSEQAKLLVWLPHFQKGLGPGDEGAVRFQLAWDLMTALEKTPCTRDAIGNYFTSKELIWALHSVDIANCVKCIMEKPTWADYNKTGFGYWCNAKTEFGAMKKAIEEIPKRILIANRGNKNPEDVALWYALLGRKTLLIALYKQADKVPLAKLLAENLHEEPWHTKIKKNAIELVRQKRYTLSAAFFFLAGEYSDAADLCVRYLQDLSLAMVVAQFGDQLSGTNECTQHVALEEVLPIAEAANDPFLKSIAYWHAGNYEMAWTALQTKGECARASSDFGLVKHSSEDSLGLPRVRKMVFQKLKDRRIEVPPSESPPIPIESYIVRRLAVVAKFNEVLSPSVQQALEMSMPRRSMSITRSLSSLYIDAPNPQACALNFDLPFLKSWRDLPISDFALSLRRWDQACLRPLRRLVRKTGPFTFDAPCFYIAMLVHKDNKIKFSLAMLLNLYALTPGLEMWQVDPAHGEQEGQEKGSAWASEILAAEFEEQEADEKEKMWTKEAQWGHLFMLISRGVTAPFWEDPSDSRVSVKMCTEDSRSPKAVAPTEGLKKFLNKLRFDAQLELRVSQLFAGLIITLCCDALRQVEPEVDKMLPIVNVIEERGRDMMTSLEDPTELAEALIGVDAELMLPSISFLTEAAYPVWRRLNCTHMLELFLTHSPKVHLSTFSLTHSSSKVLMKLKTVPAAIAGDSSQLLVKIWSDKTTGIPEDVHIPSAIRSTQWDLEAEAFLGQLADCKGSNERDQFSATTKPVSAQKNAYAPHARSNNHPDAPEPISHPKFARVHPFLPIYALVDNAHPMVQVFGFQHTASPLCSLDFSFGNKATPRGNQAKGVVWDHTHRLLGFTRTAFCLWSFRGETTSAPSNISPTQNPKAPFQPYFMQDTPQHQGIRAAIFVTPSIIATCGTPNDDMTQEKRTGLAVWDSLAQETLVAYDKMPDDQTVFDCLVVGPGPMFITVGSRSGTIGIFNIIEASWNRKLPNAHESVTFMFRMGRNMEYLATVSKSKASIKVWTHDWKEVSQREDLHADTSYLGSEDRLLFAQKMSNHHILTTGSDSVALHRII